MDPIVEETIRRQIQDDYAKQFELTIAPKFKEFETTINQLQSNLMSTQKKLTAKTSLLNKCDENLYTTTNELLQCNKGLDTADKNQKAILAKQHDYLAELIETYNILTKERESCAKIKESLLNANEENRNFKTQLKKNDVVEQRLADQEIQLELLLSEHEEMIKSYENKIAELNKELFLKENINEKSRTFSEDAKVETLGDELLQIMKNDPSKVKTNLTNPVINNVVTEKEITGMLEPKVITTTSDLTPEVITTTSVLIPEVITRTSELKPDVITTNSVPILEIGDVNNQLVKTDRNKGTSIVFRIIIFIINLSISIFLLVSSLNFSKRLTAYKRNTFIDIHQYECLHSITVDISNKLTTTLATIMLVSAILQLVTNSTCHSAAFLILYLISYALISLFTGIIQIKTKQLNCKDVGLPQFYQVYGVLFLSFVFQIFVYIKCI